MHIDADTKITNNASMKGAFKPSGDAFWDKCMQ